ncbi:MAG TPA: AsmA family protein [Chitinispirillaceae bacterium]|nr:AsmA family protein [Chitinispirillaceae bacterium]
MGKKSGNRVVLYILIGIIVLTVIGAGTVALMFPPQKIKAMVLPQVAKVLGRNVEVDGAGISIYPVIGVSLTGLKIDNTARNGFSDTAFVEVDKFLIQISFFSLLKGKPEISRIILKKPFILVETDNTGSFNYSDLAVLKSDSTLKKEEKSSGGIPVLPVPVSMKSFVIEHGSILYIDRKGKQELIVGNIDQQISFSIDKQLKDIHTSGSLVLSEVSVKDKSIRKPLTNLTITLSHDVAADLIGGVAQVNQLRLSFQKVFFNCTGSITDLAGNPVYNLSIVSDPVELKDLLAEIPLELAPDLAKIAASGILDLKLAVNGRFDGSKHLPVQGSLVVKDCSIKYTDLPKSINAFNASIQFNDSLVNIEQLRCKLGENPVALRAMVSNFSRPLLDLELKARVNLDDLKDMMMLPKGAAVSGLVNADIEAHGYVDPADPSKIDVKGTTALQNVSVLWPPIVKPAVINGLFTLSSKAIGENMSVVIGSSSLKMSASISNYLSLLLPDSKKVYPRPVAEFSLTSPMLNVDEFMPPSKESQSADKVEKPVQQPVPLIAPLPGVDMTGTVSAAKLIYNGIEMDNLLLKLRGIKDIADVDIKTGFSKGTIVELIHADLRDVQNISFTNNLKITSVQVAELIGKFGNFIQPTTPLNRELINLEKSLSGSLNLTSIMSGHGGTSDEITRTLNGMVDVSITDGRISNSLIMKRLTGVMEKFTNVDDITFRDLKAKLQIENQRVIFKQCNINAGEMGDWDVLGDVGFDAGLAMKINTRLSKTVSQKALQVQNAGKNALKGLLAGTNLGSVGNNLIDNAGIPSDKEGRITLRLGLVGSATDPKPQFLGFGEGDKSAGESASVQSKLKDQAKELVDQKKAELEKKLLEERKNAEALAKQKLDEERRNAEELVKKKLEEQKLADEANKVIQNENVKKQGDDLKKKAGSALKKIF